MTNGTPSGGPSGGPSGNPNDWQDDVLRRVREEWAREDREMGEYVKGMPKRSAEEILAGVDEPTDEELAQIEADPAGWSGFRTITPMENEAQTHQQVADVLENERLCCELMGYSANAVDCLSIAINEARERQARAEAMAEEGL